MAHCYLLQVQIDVDKFMESFTINSNGNRTSAGAWRYAPGQSAGDRDLAICKVPSVPLDEEWQDPQHGPLQCWSEHVKRCLEFLPSAMRTAKTLEGEVASSGVSKTRSVRMLRSIKKGTVGKQMGKSGRFGMYI